MISGFRNVARATRPRRPAIFTLIILLLVVAVAAKADVLIDNFGSLSGTQYDDIQGYASVGKWQNAASGGISFAPTGSSYYLNTISVLAKYFSGSSTAFELSLYTSVPTMKMNGDIVPLPGTRIASRTVNIDSSSTIYTTYTADFGSDILLSQGTSYWAIIEATSPTSDIHFGVLKGPMSSSPSFLPSARRAMYGNMLKRLNDDGTVNTNTAAPYWMNMYNTSLNVTGTACVPEPSGLVAISMGVVPLIGFIKRRLH